IGIGDEFYQAVNLDRLVVRRARIARFVGADALVLETGGPLKADVVGLGRGAREQSPRTLSPHPATPGIPPRIYRLRVLNSLSTDIGSRRALALPMLPGRVESAERRRDGGRDGPGPGR